jgi:protein-S-isoprenylcysteine O-methyltransferase Ste14
MNEIKQKAINQNKNTVHYVLFSSSFIFLLAIILGVFFDTFLNKKIFSDGVYQNIGFILLVMGSIVIYWAQKASLDFKIKIQKNMKKSYFEFGPYGYTRHPTHFGLFIMTLGFGLLINSLFSIIFTILAHLFTKIFNVKKEEQILISKYGESYSEYKKKVKNWI